MVERVGVEGHTQDRPLRDDLEIRGGSEGDGGWREIRVCPSGGNPESLLINRETVVGLFNEGLSEAIASGLSRVVCAVVEDRIWSREEKTESRLSHAANNVRTCFARSLSGLAF